MTDDEYEWLTVMRGPDVDGDGQLWYGLHRDDWEERDGAGVRLRGVPVEHVPLPRTMRPEEIEDWLSDGWADRIISNAPDAVDVLEERDDS